MTRSRMDADREAQARAELAELAAQRRRHAPQETPWLVRWLEEHANDWTPVAESGPHQKFIPATPIAPARPAPRPRLLDAENESVQTILAVERLINDGRQLSKPGRFF